MKKYKAVESCQVKGLDEIYERYFPLDPEPERPYSFIEIGAWDGKTISNTYHLPPLGWRGLYFEPVQESAWQCMMNHKGNKEVGVHRLAIAGYDGTMRIYTGTALSTSKPEVVDLYKTLDWAKNDGITHEKYEDVECMTIESALRKYWHYNNIDLVIIDVEGAEWDILQNANMAFMLYPKMFIVEAHENHQDAGMDKNSKEINEYFAKFGYTKIYSDRINNIYVLNPHPYDVHKIGKFEDEVMELGPPTDQSFVVSMKIGEKYHGNSK